MTFLQMIILLAQVVRESINSVLSFNDLFEIHRFRLKSECGTIVESVRLTEHLVLHFI